MEVVELAGPAPMASAAMATAHAGTAAGQGATASRGGTSTGSSALGPSDGTPPPGPVAAFFPGFGQDPERGGDPSARPDRDESGPPGARGRDRA